MGISVSGPHASAVHAVVAAVLKHHGFEATSTDLASENQDAVAAAAKQGKLAAIVVGEVKDGGKRLKLRVYGSGGDLVGESSWAEAAGIKKLEKVVDHTLWARVGGALSKARPPGGGAVEKAEKPEKAEAEEKEAAPEAEPPTTSSRSKESEEAAKPEEAEEPRKHRKKKKAEAEEEEPEPARPTGSAATASRSTWAALPLAQPLMVAVVAEPEPVHGRARARHRRVHRVVPGGARSRRVALEPRRRGSSSSTPGLNSERPSDGASFPTTESDYWGGVRGRLVFGVAEAALTLGGGQHSFIFHSGATPRQSLGELPDVQYTYGRAGLDLRVALPANLSLALGGGYRYVFSPGDSGFLLKQNAYLPNVKVTAFDAMAAVGYRFLRLLEVRVGADLRRYAMTAGTNTYNVTSGTDQYVAAWAQVGVLLDGYRAGEGGPAASPTKAPAHKSDDGGDDEKAGDE